MEFGDSILAIYDYFNESYVTEKTVDSKEGASYYLLYVVDRTGLINQDELMKMYRDLHGAKRSSYYVGPFESLESLNQFAFHVCQNWNADKICLVSAAEYNEILGRDVMDISSFKENMFSKANCLKNIEHKKKGFLGKIFT